MATDEETILFNELTGQQPADVDSLLTGDEPAQPAASPVPSRTSSEPTEQPDTDDDLDAVDADEDTDLPEVDETEPVDSPTTASTTIPAGVAKELRAQRKELRQQLENERLAKARLQGQLEAMEQLRQAPKPEEKSPIDLAREEDPDCIITTDLYAQQKAWELQQQQKQQEAQARAQQEANTRQQAVFSRYSAEKMGEGLDLQSLLVLGKSQLTQGDLIDIQAAGDDVARGEALYKTLRNRILLNGGSNAKVLRERIAARKARSNAQPPAPKKAGTPSKPTERTPEEPADEWTGHKAIVDFMFSEA